ncbi:type VI secretion system lipoprotein TssJ [Simiduia curdlanivorans]|uniref:Type VI secretion system lipoprotein TssJ n=1 Tax=Simiduia curdlanivorans TaxID=1492769 RepID=A0ABV8V4D0_9GAMM|nr:type VI secretion system lipoprotein TssJ [Simiduia curdlanivorans]MDN3640216.1 type VI secretion system lipoprotein TssJ [Simiduia curdlanivorans]
MMIFSKLKLTAFLLLSAAVILGCQTTRRTLNFDTTANLHLHAAGKINPDQDNRSSPLVIRIFKLADARQFGREDFLNLYEDADNRLGKDLIDTIILKELAPGETRIEKISLTPEVKYLGILAEFVQYQDAEAIALVEIIDHKTNDIYLEIKGAEIDASKQKP